MTSLKDRVGYRDNSHCSRDTEFLPVIADVLCWVGLLVCAGGFLLVIAEALAALFGLYQPTSMAPASP
jgi:hypothetical protein